MGKPRFDRVTGERRGLLREVDCLGAAALDVVGDDHGGYQQGYHYGEEPGSVIDQFRRQGGLEGGEQEAQPGEATLTL